MTHTTCSHDRTPAARKACRAARRDAIKRCQVAYAGAENGTLEIAEYEAMIDLLSGKLGVALADAYLIVEEGPIL